jgi:uncharacterized protein YneF (UPF0154 family)
MIDSFLSIYNVTYIIITVVSIGIGTGFGIFAKKRLDETVYSPWSSTPPLYFRLLILEEGIYGRLFSIIAILSAIVFKWWYVIAFILIYILAGLFCGTFEGIYQRLTKQRLHEKWTVLKILALPLDFLMIKYVLNVLPNQIEIFGLNISTNVILLVSAIILAVPALIAESKNPRFNR